MRTLPWIIAGLLALRGIAEEKPRFGGAPRDAAAYALRDRIVEARRTQGIEPAIRILDREGRDFIKRSDATGWFDFFEALREETTSGGGRADHDWRLAVTEWCYRYCTDVGEGYWASQWTPLMHERCFEAGRYGAARGVIDRERARLLEECREIDLEKLKPVRPAHPGFPAIQLRSLGARERIDTKAFAFFMAGARQDLVEGKWRRGIEAAVLAADSEMGNLKWYQQRPNLTDSKAAVRDKTGNWREAKLLVADGYRFLGLVELELGTLRELCEFNPGESLGAHRVATGRCRALHAEYVLGQKGPEVVMEIGKVSRGLEGDAGAPRDDAERMRLLIADIHFRQGNAKRGWEVLGEVRGRDLSRDARFEADREWCRHRVDLGLADGVEPVLVDLLRIAREGGLKQREIDLYEIYARLLVSLGRYDDALAIQQELIRLLRSFDLFPRLPAALAQLARIHALIGERSRAEARLREAREMLEQAELPAPTKEWLGAPLGKKLPGPADGYEPAATRADLQPRRAVMVPLEGLPSRGLFTLSNFSAKPVRGKLHFRGSGLSLGAVGDASVTVNVAAPGGGGGLTHPLEVPAGEMVAIDLAQAPAADSGTTTVTILWQPEEGEPQTAEWSAEPAEQGVSIAVTDAGDYFDNPFYLIPVYHLIQYQDAFAEVADLRVVASAPTRVELYDSNDELVFVDADGDGAFTSEGDIISKDLNRNGSGDLVLDASAKELRFRLFVRPIDRKGLDELTLDLQMLWQGEWITHSTDRLIFAGAAE